MAKKTAQQQAEYNVNRILDSLNRIARLKGLTPGEVRAIESSLTESVGVTVMALQGPKPQFSLSNAGAD